MIATRQRVIWKLRPKSKKVVPLPAIPTIFLDDEIAVSYLASLKDFLVKKGIAIVPFNHDFSYAQGAVILLAKASAEHQNGFLMTEDKSSLWAYLKSVFPNLM